MKKWTRQDAYDRMWKSQANSLDNDYITIEYLEELEKELADWLESTRFYLEIMKQGKLEEIYKDTI